jgi:hypothetical protein
VTAAEEELARLRAELAALRAVARGYCPACGRGDAAPTVEDWERERRRADRAEKELARHFVTTASPPLLPVPGSPKGTR